MRSTPPGGHSASERSASPSPLDAAVIAAAAAGDQDAWRRLIDTYTRRVYALAQAHFRNPELAEEITQSVLATLAHKLPDYQELGRFEPWLFRITMNRVRDEARRRRRDAAATPEQTLRLAGAIDDDPPAEDLDRLRAAVATLPDADREIISLRHHAGLSFQQAADILGEPVGTLLARHHRALRKLRKILEPAAEIQP